MIFPIIETLKVDFVEIHPGTDELQHFGRGVAVRNEPSHEPGRFGLPEDIDGPIGRDERLVIGADDAPGTLTLRQGDQFFRSNGSKIKVGPKVAKGLGRDPVLAVAAMEITAEHAEAERP